MRYLTVVYTINDEEKFSGELNRINSLCSPSFGKNWAITAWSRENELNRLDMIEDVCSSGNIDSIDEIENIIRCADLSKYERKTK